MKHVIDDYGKERWVESEYDDGKARVWYQYRSDGKLLRWEHNGFANSSVMADAERFAGNGASARNCQE